MSVPGYGLDTTVVVRLISGQPEAPFQCAFEFLTQQVVEGRAVYVSGLVLSEAYFALQTHYGFTKKDALRALRSFIEHSGVVTSSGVRTVLQRPRLEASNPGFIDRLIHAEYFDGGLRMVSFEKASTRLSDVEVLN